jgi:hypothetical protein
MYQEDPALSMINTVRNQRGVLGGSGTEETDTLSMATTMAATSSEIDYLRGKKSRAGAGQNS